MGGGVAQSVAQNLENIPEKIMGEDNRPDGAPLSPVCLGLYGKIGKRILDVCLSGLMIVGFLPLLLIIAAWLRLSGVKSVIFRHERVGYGGRQFNCLKFRTMYPDADACLARILEEDETARQEWTAYRKLKNDPRIISGIGRLLRITSLDELPQLFNVLAGDMSMVGPRPVTSEELENYDTNVTCYLSVKPGLTGPWQVGGRSNTTFQDRVAKDVWYVNNMSLQTDLSLVFRTATSLLSGRLAGAC